MDKFKEAAADLDEAVQADPQSALAWTTRGQAYERLGDKDKAKASYGRALAIRPRDEAARTGLARVGGSRAFSNFCELRGSLGAANKILWPSPRRREAAMGYSNDLRVRVIRVVEGGVAARAAARQFVIGDATAIRWAKRWRETGSFEAKSNKGQSRSPLKKHEEWLLGLVRQEPDLTLEEIQRRLLEERQQKAGLGSVWRFFDRHGISFKKKRSGGRAGSA